MPNLAKLQLTFGDYSREKSRTEIYGVAMTAANFDLQISQQNTLRDAIIGIQAADDCLMSVSRHAYDTVVSNEFPDNPEAQREKKWLVVYRDTTTQKLYRIEIPCADLTLLADASDEMDLSAQAAATFVAAFETYARSEDGNAVSVERIVFVGRNR